MEYTTIVTLGVVGWGGVHHNSHSILHYSSYTVVQYIILHAVLTVLFRLPPPAPPPPAPRRRLQQLHHNHEHVKIYSYRGLVEYTTIVTLGVVGWGGVHHNSHTRGGGVGWSTPQ